MEEENLDDEVVVVDDEEGDEEDIDAGVDSDVNDEGEELLLSGDENLFEEDEDFDDDIFNDIFE